MWPPSLGDLKSDLGVSDTRDDILLQQNLDAAVALVSRVRDDINYDDDPLSEFPLPDAGLLLGTIRLAGRWFTRRRSPDALVVMSDIGSSRVPSFDPDIENLLRVGRYRKATFA